MAEYIEREALKDVYQRYLNAPHVQIGNNIVGQGLQIAIKTCIALLDNARTADVVEVVRCEKCQHMDEGWCSMHDTSMHSIDFCSYGERRNDATD